MQSQKKSRVYEIHHVINIKEQALINSIKPTFEREYMKTQYRVLGYRIDLCFH